ncbi:MAG: hypothetical protein AWU58_507 [Methanohalophilus sp. T328-1]|jgi:hypothetical protein|uniref:DUF2953 domain-containing protein n=2 Tax=Methanohalophilus euhalobius TaxID=51203 RepID=A0A3M9L5C2_9EURY|nr:MAG: hypothetical protein AWU58_507 [Methanohalophilus sp. T328-1]RNI07633.1 DUF2953 domain-containing protein [Methanohalophilus euhalobius]
MWPMIIFSVILLLLVVAILFLFVAFDVTFRFTLERNSYKTNLKITWLGISRNIKPSSNKKNEEQEDEIKTDRSVKYNPTIVNDLSSYSSIFFEIKNPLFRFVSDILKAIHFRSLSLDMRYGFDDPAYTGILCGFLHAALGIVKRSCPQCNYQIVPCFNNEFLEIDASGSFRIRLYRFMPGLLRFFSKKVVIKNLWISLKNKY